jgi:perosamine synthetase
VKFVRPIPVAAPDLSGSELEYVTQAVQSSWISSTGPFVDRFETEFARMCDARSAISICNGTAALHLALVALELDAGDEVIVPSLTYVATANAVHYVGARPAFADVDPRTWCLDPTAVEAAITPRTKGIIAVHLYGHPADMDALSKIASRHGLWLIEDAAEAHFARYKGRIAGSLADLATFSFYGNKPFTCGEGGAITLDDPALEARVRLLRGQGMDPDRRYYFPVTGYNYRLTNVACALVCAQLERRDEILGERQRIFERYRELLTDVPGLTFQPVAAWAEPTPWLFSVLIDPGEFGMSRDDLAEELATHGIETRPFFVPLHTLPPFRDASCERRDDLPWTERLAGSGLSLPTYNGLTGAQQEWIAETIAASARSDSRAAV